MTVTHALVAVLINLLWGSMFVAAAIGLEDFPPIFFTAIRFTLLAVLLVGFLRVPPGLTWPLFKIGLVMGAGMYLTLYLSIALAENTASIAVFSKLEVPLSLLLGVLLLGERIGIQRITGVTVAMIGALIIGFDPAAFDDLPALGWMVVSCVFSAFGFILVRKLGKVHPLTIVAWVSLVSAPVLLATSLVLETDHWRILQQASGSGWLSLAYTAIMSSVVANSGLYYLLQRYPVGTVMPFSLLSPVFGVAGAMIFLGDQLNPGLVVGGVMILFGVGWIYLRNARKAAPAVSDQIETTGK